MWAKVVSKFEYSQDCFINWSICFWKAACCFWKRANCSACCFWNCICWRNIISIPDGLKWENTRSFCHFLYFFSSRTEKRIIVLSDVFCLPPDVFSAHFTPVATGRYVFRYGLLRPPLGHPRGDPGLAPDSTALRYRLRDPSLLPLRSLRKVVRDPKKSSRTNRFSVLSEEKKKTERKNV